MTSKYFMTPELPSKTHVLVIYLLTFATSAAASIHNGGNSSLECEDPPDSVLHAMLTSPVELHASFFQLPVLLNMSATLDTFKTENAHLVKIKHSVMFDDGNSCPRNLSLRNHDPCPLRWVLNVDEHRRPKVLLEAQCKKCSEGCMGIQLAECTPIRYHVKVLRRHKCDQSRKYNYTQVWEPITVGCACRGPAYRFAANPIKGVPSKGE